MTPFVHPLSGKALHLGRRQRSIHNKRSAKRALAMHRFLSSLPDAPISQDNTFGITSFGEMLNDQLGDCTIACPGHQVQIWTASQGNEQTVPDSVILKAYEQWDGYVAGDPSTDNGGIILNVIQDWANEGLGGFQITAHGEVPLTQQRIQQALWLFGTLNCGVELPISAQSQVGAVWDIVGDGVSGDSAAGSWGGHCTAICGYDVNGLTCITWGALQKMTWRFFMFYYDEAHAILSPNWKTPLSTQTLETDMALISGANAEATVNLPPLVVNP